MRVRALWKHVIHWCLCVAALSFLFVPNGASAAGFAGLLQLVIKDANTGQPIEGARLLVTGPRQVAQITDATGQVSIRMVPGIYVVSVAAPGYLNAEPIEIEILESKVDRIEFTLQPQLKVIGSVTAASKHSRSSETITDLSSQRKVSETLLDSLDKLSGVQTDPATGGISLNNQDAANTGISIDGVPVGSSEALNRSISGDLFSDATVDFKNNPMALGGTINFQTLEPTRHWLTRLSGSYGTYNQGFYQASETGASGKLAVAAQFAHRTTNAALDGSSYLDQSGLTYAHQATDLLNSNFAKARYALTPRITLLGSILESNTSGNNTCSRFFTVLPCGFGPNITTQNRLTLKSFSVSALAGDTALSLTLGDVTSGNSFDGSSRQFDGIAVPYSYVSAFNDKSVFIKANATVKRHELEFSVSHSKDRVRYTPVGNALFEGANEIPIAQSTIKFSDHLRIGRTLSVRGDVSYLVGSRIPATLAASLTASYSPTVSQTIELGISTGSGVPLPFTSSGLSDPFSAEFNCSSGASYVSGLSAAPSPQTSNSAQATWTLSGSTISTTIRAYYQKQSGQPLSVMLPLSADVGDPLVGPYLKALAGVWSIPSVCGNVNFHPDLVYARTFVTDTQERYSGVDVSARIALGKSLILLPTYSINAAVLTSADPRFQSPASFYIVGQQLPGRPLHRAGFILDGVSKETEWLVNGQWTSGNNQRGLPAYFVLNLGLDHTFRDGSTLTFLLANALGSDAEKIATPQFASTRPLVDGGSLQTNPIPLSPPRFTVQYSTRIGIH